MTIQTTTYPGINLQSLPVEEQRELINSTVARVAQEIVSISNQIQEKAKKDSKMLDRGIWYAQDYIDALRHRGQNNRLHWFQENGYNLKGYASKRFFEVDLHSLEPFKITARRDVAPSDALDAALQGLTVIDCGSFIYLVHYVALREILGTEKFNHTFKNPPINLHYLDTTAAQPLENLIDFTDEVKTNGENSPIGTLGNRPVRKGQIALFRGVESYHQKHPYGEGGSYNVICIDDTPEKQRFVGFGLPSEGITEEKLNRELVKFYNAPESLNEFMSQKQLTSFVLNNPQMPFIVRNHMHDTRPVENANEEVVGFDPCSIQEMVL